MNESLHIQFDVGSLLIFLGLGTLLLIGVLLVSAVLGQRQTGQATKDPFESGILPTGTARIRFDIKFYLMAMFFVVFDLEAVFIYLWAVVARPLGWQGYLEMVVFIGLLMLGLFYLWRLGALDWGVRRPEN